MTSQLRILLISTVIVVAVAGSTGLVTRSNAQSTNPPTQSTDQSISDKAKATADDVSKWTWRQWHAAKSRWAKESDKWHSCNQQATDKKLKGRASWSFIYQCMTAS